MMVKKMPLAILVIWSTLIIATNQNSRKKRQILADQPRLITENGHLIFQSGTNHNITFRGGEGSGFLLNNIDLKVALTQVETNKANIVALQSNMSSMSNNFTNQLGSLESVVNGSFTTVRSRVDSWFANTRQVRVTQRLLSSRMNSAERNITAIQMNIRRNIETAIPQIRSRLETLESNANRTREVDGSGESGSEGGGGQGHQIQDIQRRLVTLEDSMRDLRMLLTQNECQSNPCLNGGTCVDMYNGYLCRCPPNWQGAQCTEDVNECAMYAGTDMGCQNGATCTNTQGSFSCHCTENWYGIHCSERHNDCAGASHAELCGHGTCVDETRVQPGQPRYRCICNAGWTHNSTVSPACIVDIDECVSEEARCSVNPPVRCRNIPGSFLCESCPPGYTGNGFRCYDINECLINNGGCSTNPWVDCFNTVGSRRCGSCPEGFEDRAGVCVRVSDSRCSTNNGGCYPQATCQDNGGFGVSCFCPEGLAGNGHGPQGCVPLASYGACHSNPCQNGASCMPIGQHQFTCHCAQGYSGQICNTTVNPCASNPCLNGGVCTQQGTRFTCQCTTHYTGPICGQPQQVCGGPLTDESGSFRFQSETVTFQNNLTCSWVITTTPGKALSIIFTNFSLESETNCTHDYLQINDGLHLSSKLIGRYCGVNPLNGQSINSTQHQIHLLFYSHHSTNRDDFTVNWTSHVAVCGGDSNDRNHGIISSPGYPTSYLHNSDCVWTISVSPGSVISIHFVEVALEHHTDCLHDYLEIRDGQTEDARLLVRFCQSETPPSPIQTTGPFAFVRFHSDNDTSDKGFKITYAATTDGVIPGCGSNKTGDIGSVISPGYPTSYRRNMLCVWNIWVPTGFFVLLTFEDFDLQTTNGGCTANSLVVRDGENQTATLLGFFCGSATPAQIRSSNNVMYLELRSDGHLSGNGFKVQWTKACGGTFTGSSGQIQSPGWPNIYPINADCEYTIQVPSGGILLSFNNFDLGDSNCLYDYVEVYNGAIAPGNLLGHRLCSTNRPDYMRGASNEMVVKFVTSGSIHGTGFQATYTAENEGPDTCWYVINQNSETIRSPQHPSEYPHGINCTWYITVDPGHVIRLTFQMFSFEEKDYQCHDYLEVFDNSTMYEGSSLGRFCGSSAPPFLTSTDNAMVLYMKTDENINREGFLATFFALNQSHLCSEDHRQQAGVVTSPNYPGLYPHDRECEWTITVPEGMQILVNITDFELEGTPESHTHECPYDYLDIRNGGYLSSPVLKKLCGNQPAVEPFISHSNRLYLKFKSDHSVQRRGFRLEYSSGATGCGGLMTTPTGGFVSPNYPGYYSHNTECFWTIIVAKGSKIVLTFIDLDAMSYLRGCLDYIRIYDGGQKGKMIKELCGTSLPIPIISKTNKMWIKFSTHHFSRAGSRFRAQYYTDCNTKITGQHGVIESPNFPDNYPHSQNCTWTIEVPLGNNINVSFAAFILEYHPNCQYDYLKVIDGSNNSLLCGPDVPQPFRSSNNVLKINLITDSSQSFTGFRLEWIKDGCGGKLTRNSGGFTSPGYPSHYPHQVICTWEIEVELGMSVEFTIHTFDLETSSNCLYDVLEVHAGSDREDFLLSKICHRQSGAQVVTASGNTMFVYFESDLSVHGTGFNATYKAIPNGCGGNYSTRNGFISSKNFPEPYDHNSVCEWLITVEPSHVVALTFLNFGLEGHNCTYDYVDVYDGNSTDAAQLGHFCGTNIPPALRSLGNQMFIKMVADESVNGLGFKAEYKTGCGGELNADVDGAVSSPLYPNSIDPDSECVWIISSSSNTKRVTLHFTSMNIEDYTDCSAAWVTVTDGRDALVVADGELENKYCGLSLPASITSRGSSLRVYFKSSHFARGKGFRAVYSSSFSSCNVGNITSLTGRFTSPWYPDNYPDDIECVWQINTSPGNAFQLSFSTFELTGGLNDDYLEIRTPDVNGELVGRWSGQDRPSNLTNFFGAWIKFRTNERETSRGFTAEWSASTVVVLTGNRGQIASPNYPSEYPPFANYRWKVQVAQNMTIRIKFDAMAIWPQTGNGGCDDYVEFFDGPQGTGNSLGRFCGVILPEIFVSSSNEVTIAFASDGYLELTGFLLTWEAVLSNDLQAPDFPHSRPTVSGCGGSLMLSNVSQELTTPGYPDGYADNLDCYWTIVVPVGYSVLATIQNISLDSRYWCPDFIQFHDIISPFDEYATYCERENTGVLLESVSNVLSIYFHSDNRIHGQGVSINLRQGCGSSITASNGIISSPNYPADYPANQNCTWEVKVARGKTVGLTFNQHFIIGDPGDCNKDYLKLLNGYSPSSPPLIVNGSSNTNGTYCGVTAPQGLVTSSNYFFAQFVSDGTGSGAGFSFNFSEISLACGEHLRLTNVIPSGYFMSPNYPQNYPENVDCTWLITAPAGKRIKIDFEVPFVIESDEGCTKWYLAFHDGGTLNSPRIGEHLCGSTLPRTIFSTEHIIFVRFRTDRYRVATGFKAKYSIASCGFRTYDSNGVIMSPNYPENYGDNQECEWFIVGPTGHYIIINITNFNIQPSENCTADVLEIRDGNASDTSLFRNCGHNNAVQSIETSDSIAYVRFKSDVNQVDKGFRIVFQASLEECGGQLTTPSNMFSSPNFPRSYQQKRRCEWVIVVNPERSITLTFNNFNLEENVYPCNYIYVEIYNGKEEDSPLIGRFCNNIIPGPFQSSGNEMRVVFQAHGSPRFTGTGFRAVYTSDSELECGGDLTERSGVIASPPTNYSLTHQCIWRLNIYQPSQTSVKLTFLFFDIAGRFPCASDFLEVREGLDKSGALVNRYCGYNTPNPIILPGVDLWLRYTKRQANNQGFNLSYEYSNCGGIYTDNDGVISSPNYPVNNNQNKSCAWKIIAPDGFTIRLQVTDFDFPLGCNQENLSLQNGAYFDSPNIGIYCNQTRPPDFVSQSNALRLIMVNGISAVNRRGFRMTYTFESGGCGRLYHNDSGLIKSPNYPRSYPHNVECRWDITVNPGNSVKLKFQPPFDLEANDCHYDHVEVYDVLFNGSLVLLGSYCSNINPPDQKSSSNRMVVIFRSDSDTNGNGFSAKWSAECGGLFTSDKGTLYSPGYPQSYPNNANCTYIIKPPDNKLILLRFVDFALQGANGWLCINDYVAINPRARSDMDYQNDWLYEYTRRLCGTYLPRPVLSPNQMIIKFMSDSSETMRGFQAQYDTEDCGGNLTDPSGTISTGSFQNSHSFSGVCTWSITVETNKVVILKLLSFAPNRSDFWYCSVQNLNIYDGSNDNAPLLARVCDSSGIPSKIKSSNNTMFLKYVTSMSYYISRKGFNAIYSSTYGPSAGCGGTLRQPSGTIRSIDIDNNGQYEPDLNCEWLIYVGDNKIVTINITDIHIAGQSYCQGNQSQDQLTIYEGETIYDMILGNYCQQTSDQYLTAGSNVILVVFNTDSEGSAAGFTATFVERDPLCGGVFNATSEEQIISSPNYPNYFNQVLRCNWFIDSGSNMNFIKIEVTDLQIEACSVTDGSLLSITDKSMHDVGQTLPLCGTTLPSPFYSLGQRVKIVYNVLQSYNSRFQLKYSLSGCSRNYTQSNARISNHDSVGNYQCVIKFQSPENTTLAIYFRRFNFDENYVCFWSHLEVLNSSSLPVKRYCGEYIPPPIFFPDNIATLKFNLDYSFQKPVYDITFISSTAGSGCGGEINETRFGVFTSPNYPTVSNISQTCSWLITPPIQTTLYFKFSHLSSQSGVCDNNYVAVYQGISTNKPLLGRYCNEPGSEVQFSAAILLQYVSPDPGFAPIFKFEFAPTLTLLNT